MNNQQLKRKLKFYLQSSDKVTNESFYDAMSSNLDDAYEILAHKVRKDPEGKVFDFECTDKETDEVYRLKAFDLDEAITAFRHMISVNIQALKANQTSHEMS